MCTCVGIGMYPDMCVRHAHMFASMHTHPRWQRLACTPVTFTYIHICIHTDAHAPMYHVTLLYAWIFFFLLCFDWFEVRVYTSYACMHGRQAYLCMYVCMRVCVQIYAYTRIHVHRYTYIHVWKHQYPPTYIHTAGARTPGSKRGRDWWLENHTRRSKGSLQADPATAPGCIRIVQLSI